MDTLDTNGTLVLQQENIETTAKINGPLALAKPIPGTVIQPTQPVQLTPEQRMQDWEIYNRNMQLMKDIAAQMKEVAILPSEVLTDQNPLIRVEMPEKGGVLTTMLNHEFPYKGFPFYEFVERIDTIKKVQRASLSSFYHSLKARSKVKLFFLIFVPWLFGDFVRSYLYSFHRILDRFKLKPIRYCDAMRELHRAMSYENQDELVKDQTFRYSIRDIACMIMEFDNAYRFRFQDIIVELDKEKLKRSPSKEIVRLLNILSAREVTQEIKDTWKLAKFFLPYYLLFNRKLRDSLIRVLSNLDLEKVKLAPEDIHFCEERKDYVFGFMNKKWKKEYEKKKKKKRNKKPSTAVVDPSTLAIKQ